MRNCMACTMLKNKYATLRACPHAGEKPGYSPGGDSPGEKPGYSPGEYPAKYPRPHAGENRPGYSPGEYPAKYPRPHGRISRLFSSVWTQNIPRVDARLENLLENIPAFLPRVDTHLWFFCSSSGSAQETSLCHCVYILVLLGVWVGRYWSRFCCSCSSMKQFSGFALNQSGLITTFYFGLFKFGIWLIEICIVGHS